MFGNADNLAGGTPATGTDPLALLDIVQGKDEVRLTGGNGSAFILEGEYVLNTDPEAGRKDEFTSRRRRQALPLRAPSFECLDGPQHHDAANTLKDLAFHIRRFLPWMRFIAAPVIMVRGSDGQMHQARSAVRQTVETVKGIRHRVRVSNLLISTALTPEEAFEAVMKQGWHELTREAEIIWPDEDGQPLTMDSLGFTARVAFSLGYAQDPMLTDATKNKKPVAIAADAFHRYAMACMDDPEMAYHDHMSAGTVGRPFHKAMFAAALVGRSMAGEPISGSLARDILENRNPFHDG